ncbi:MAG: nucleoside phosphorylase [Anaerolineae bacterium]
MDCDYPILEYDSAPRALIEPGDHLQPLPDMPARVVLCFFQEVIAKVCGDALVVGRLKSEIGHAPIYALTVDGGQRVAVAHPGVGAPLAGGFLDELIALGGQKFIACGGAGVLRSEIAAGQVIVPERAVRDEGTSYHYLPPAREVAAAPEAVAAIRQTLERRGVPHLVGKTWTTDGVYRETPGKIARRRAEGCLTVEMEAAAFFAVAQFRGVPFGQILYGGDDVGGAVWDQRDWIHGHVSTRETLFWLAVKAVARL